MEKRTDAEGFFDDGLTYLFLKENTESGENELVSIRPGHIHFEVYSGVEGIESCDFRFYSVEKKAPEEEEKKDESTESSNTSTEESTSNTEENNGDSNGDDGNTEQENAADDGTRRRALRMLEEGKDNVGGPGENEGEAG